VRVERLAVDEIRGVGDSGDHRERGHRRGRSGLKTSALTTPGARLTSPRRAFCARGQALQARRVAICAIARAAERCAIGARTTKRGAFETPGPIGKEDTLPSGGEIGGRGEEKSPRTPLPPNCEVGGGCGINLSFVRVADDTAQTGNDCVGLSNLDCSTSAS